jgi:hypothetical protein
VLLLLLGAAAALAVAVAVGLEEVDRTVLIPLSDDGEVVLVLVDLVLGGIAGAVAVAAAVAGASWMVVPGVAFTFEAVEDVGSFFLKKENKVPCFNVLPVLPVDVTVLALVLLVVLGLPLPAGDLRLVPEMGVGDMSLAVPRK